MRGKNLIKQLCYRGEERRETYRERERERDLWEKEREELVTKRELVTMRV